MSIVRRAAADGAGTAFLVAAVVGSGIMGERLAGGNVAIALLANSFATGCALVALILAFEGRSGAHFNPVVTCALALCGRFPKRDVAPYLVAQFSGALLGVLAAHFMFDMPLIQASLRERAGAGQWLSEVVATFGLVFVVFSCDRRPGATALAVGAYIAAAYWFTASTSFANPVLTLARSLTATFSGIDPSNLAPFIASQCIGAALALCADHLLRARPSTQDR